MDRTRNGGVRPPLARVQAEQALADLRQRGYKPSLDVYHALLEVQGRSRGTAALAATVQAALADGLGPAVHTFNLAIKVRAPRPKFPQPPSAAWPHGRRCTERHAHGGVIRWLPTQAMSLRPCACTSSSWNGPRPRSPI